MERTSSQPSRGYLRDTASRARDLPRSAVVVVLTLAIVLLPGIEAGAENRRIVEAPKDYGTLLEVAPGDSGHHVSVLQDRLAQAGFFTGHVTGTFDDHTGSAVVALHKLIGTDRTTTFGLLDWAALDGVLSWRIDDYGIPDRWDEPDRIELDLTRQLMFLVRGGDVHAILPISSGGSYSYWSERNQKVVRAGTPRGDFTLFRHDVGWRCEEITGWCVQNYWAFHPFYGIHGYRSVPTYPASHGCARVHTWDSEWLEGQLELGMPVHIWDDMPEVEGPPAPPSSIRF